MTFLDFSVRSRSWAAATPWLRSIRALAWFSGFLDWTWMPAAVTGQRSRRSETRAGRGVGRILGGAGTCGGRKRQATKNDGLSHQRGRRVGRGRCARRRRVSGNWRAGRKPRRRESGGRPLPRPPAGGSSPRAPAVRSPRQAAPSSVPRTCAPSPSRGSRTFRRLC